MISPSGTSDRKTTKIPAIPPVRFTEHSKTTQLSTVVPIKDTDLVTGYLVIHYPMKNLYESRSNIVEVMVLIFIVIYALFSVFF